MLDITTTEDDCLKVCLTEDGITKCTFVSSMHLVQDKEKGLRAAIKRAAAKAFE
jgi:hypothetical protein